MVVVKNFKNFVGKFLNESPYTQSDYKEENLYKSIKYNENKFKEIYETYTKIQDISFNNNVLTLYKKNYGLVNVYSVIDINNKLFCAYFLIKTINKSNIELGGVWNHPNYKGLMTSLWNSFILKLDFKTIRCDGGRSTSGKSWFNKVILQPCLNNPEKFKCYIRNIDSLETFYPQTIEEFDKFYGENVLKFAKFRVYIEKI